MKIVAINGSPKGQKSNTAVLVSAFLQGAQDAGAETVNIFLADKDINHCKGCHICWERGPGQCVTNDDMLGILAGLGGADIILFASPVYFENISGMLKVFMDRMTMIGGPQTRNESTGRNQQADHNVPTPKLMMISNCGYADRSEFAVTSLWINRVAKQMHMDLAGEIYAVKGKYLTAPPDELNSVIADYLELLKLAGKEIATSRKLSNDTERRLQDVNEKFA